MGDALVTRQAQTTVVRVLAWFATVPLRIPWGRRRRARARAEDEAIREMVVRPPLARRQLHQQIGQGDVGPEPAANPSLR
jgi:hypothetical protein